MVAITVLEAVSITYTPFPQVVTYALDPVGLNARISEIPVQDLSFL